VKTCLLDIDGVLARFQDAACEFHGISNYFHMHPDDRGAGYWDFYRQCGFTHESFFSPLTRSFWATIPLTKEAYSILDLVDTFFGDNVILVTAPTAPLRGDRTCYLKDKHLLAAGKQAILIDDSPHQIRKFWEAGGTVITCPRMWNEGYKNEPHLIEYLEDRLTAAFNGAPVNA
jgi:hypothetical protein